MSQLLISTRDGHEPNYELFIMSGAPDHWIMNHDSGDHPVIDLPMNSTVFEGVYSACNVGSFCITLQCNESELRRHPVMQQKKVCLRDKWVCRKKNVASLSWTMMKVTMQIKSWKYYDNCLYLYISHTYKNTFFRSYGFKGKWFLLSQLESNHRTKYSSGTN